MRIKQDVRHTENVRLLRSQFKHFLYVSVIHVERICERRIRDEHYKEVPSIKLLQAFQLTSFNRPT